MTDDTSRVVSRRHLLRWAAAGVGTLIVGSAAGLELVNTGVLPGKQYLDEIDGACSVPAPALEFAPLGPSSEGTFYSHARRREVGYTLAYPSGHGPGDRLALVVMLHGFGGTHRDAFVGMSPAQAAALKVNASTVPAGEGTPSPATPLAIVTVDGGAGYWNPHPGDDPMTMVMDELIPMCQARGLGTSGHGVGLMGISMGGYGAIAMAERYPDRVRAAAAISPAVWTSFDQAHAANAGAFASPLSFEEGDVIAHALELAKVPTRVAVGRDDPFFPGVERLINVASPAGPRVSFVGQGCHTGPFFLSQEPPSLAYLGFYLR